ncbi:MAG: DNA-binding response regulator [Myxococcales bacterium]|nr:DNA-binding response regulator [Myxococcales bacterium]
MPPEVEVTTDETVLVVDDEVNLRKVLGTLLRRAGYSVRTAGDGIEALEVLSRESISVIVTDLKMPRMDGLALLKKIRSQRPDIPVILITAFGTVDRAVGAIKAGAFDFITKPFDRNEIKQIIAKAAQQYRLNQREVIPSEEEDLGPVDHAMGQRFGMVGSSPEMNQVYSIIERVANTPSTILITGESGTGKELVARALHENSDRKNQSFIRINCAAIPKDLVESELFGHERGAFTGAVNSKPGRFELANRGTLFLDEVSEIPLEIQVKLLRALQENQFERVGGVRTIDVEVRLIAATNQDLQQLIAEGRFREDLFYRLNVVPVALPPLRNRGHDIPAIIRHAIVRAAGRLGRAKPMMEDATLEALCQYSWPGNIRELENVVERMVLLSDNTTFGISDLPPEVLKGIQREVIGNDNASMDLEPGVFSLKEAVRQGRERIERELISRALEETGQNVTRAAQALEISRKSLQLKMKDLGFRDTDQTEDS